MRDVLTVESLGKQYRRYHPDRPRSLKAALARGFRGTRSVDRFWALRDVSFALKAGEMLGVIGSNGSGKSTLLHLLGGVMEPEEGRVRTQGRVRALLELGSGFHPELSGRENILVGGVAAGMLRREVEERFDEIVAFAEIEDFLDSPLRTYSSGMKLRLGFAVAVHADPDLLLIDEVLTVGDLGFQYKCLDRIRRYRDRGCAIVLVSHDLDQVSQLCDRVLWLKKGQVRGFGPPEVVVGEYRAAASAETRRRMPLDHPSRKTRHGTDLTVGENRFGSLDAEITEVRLLDVNGNPCTTLRGGEPLIVEIAFRSAATAEAPIFCVSISDEDRVLVEVATDADRAVLPASMHSGTVRLEIDRLDLAGGRYYVDVGIFEPEWTFAYDYHWHAYPLVIDAKRVGQSLVAPPHRWTMPSMDPSKQPWNTERKFSTSTS